MRMVDIMRSAYTDLMTAPFAGQNHKELMYVCWRIRIMKRTHGIVFWLVFLSAILPVADGMVTGVSLDFARSPHCWTGNLVAILIVAAIILGVACVFDGKHT